MTTYVALLRGINSGANPSQKMDKLRRIFEAVGFQNVRTVIASGNVIFESDEKDRILLETKIEEALKKGTGVETATIVRTKEEIARLVELNPFKKINISQNTRPHVTFVKTPPKEVRLPDGSNYQIIGFYTGAVCFVIDLSGKTKTPDVMRIMEKTFGKGITTRTWATVERILHMTESSS